MNNNLYQKNRDSQSNRIKSPKISVEENFTALEYNDSLDQLDEENLQDLQIKKSKLY